MTGKERAQFRAQANSLEPVFQIGKGGVSDALIKQTTDALKARELIKIKALLESIHETPRELADRLSEATGAEVIQVIGGCIVLYKENPELREAEKEKAKRKKEAAKKAKLKARQTETKRYPRFAAKIPDGKADPERKPYSGGGKADYKPKPQAGEGKASYRKAYNGAGKAGYKAKPQSGEHTTDRRQSPRPAGNGSAYKSAQKPAPRGGNYRGGRPAGAKGAAGSRPRTSSNSSKSIK